MFSTAYRPDSSREIGHISPKLQQLFEEFFLHFRNLWVWTKCNAILHAAGVVDSSLREKHLKTALETLPPYPPRKTSRSRVKSFRRFCNEVLRRAPMKVGDAGLETVRLASGGTRHIWSVEYLAEVYEMLNSIIDKYGIEGWKRIRWTVYKTVSTLSYPVPLSIYNLRPAPRTVRGVYRRHLFRYPESYMG